LTITNNGEVVENKLVTGNINVNASNVTIRNVRVYGVIAIRNWEGPNNLTIIDTEIGPQSGYIDTDLITTGSYSCTRCNVHSTTGDGFKFISSGSSGDSGVTVQDSYFHDFKYTNGAHNDGAQTMGISNATIHHNTFDGSNGQLTSGIMLGNEQGNLDHITIDQNYFAGDGNYAIYGGSNQSTGYEPTNTSFTNNRFLKGSFTYGTHVYIAPSSVWTGNAYTDGTAIPK
jgi:hypothetical protein